MFKGSKKETSIMDGGDIIDCFGRNGSSIQQWREIWVPISKKDRKKYTPCALPGDDGDGDGSGRGGVF